MIYLDNAATSFPKPSRVQDEVLRAICEYGGNPGRGAHRLSLAAARCVYDCREAVSELLGLRAPEHIVFTASTTHALNIAIKGLLRTGDHVLISELEHNAVRRPLCRLSADERIQFDTFPVVGKSADEIIAELRTRRKAHTRAVICTHASNICSISLPLAEIGAFCRQNGLLFIVDAAQSTGHLPIDMQAMQIDALAAPGHKGLLGIQGCGILALGESIRPTPLTEGGSGVDSLDAQMPQEPPERYEAGTLPVPAIASVLAGIRFLRERSEELHAQEEKLFCALRERLSALPDLTLYAPEAIGAVLLFNRKGYSPAAVARELDNCGICVRAGLHCAPLAHTALGTPVGGAVRVSIGPFNTLHDADALWRALK